MGGLNDRLFLNVCGTGFDVTVLDYTLAAKKYCRGLLPYLIGLIRGIAHISPCMCDSLWMGTRRREKY